jgi:hypothetical protein
MLGFANLFRVFEPNLPLAYQYCAVVLKSHSEGFAKHKVNLDGIVLEKLFRHKALVLSNATEKASKKVLNLSFIDKDIGAIVQNLVVDFEASLKIVHGVRSQSQELVESFLAQGIAPIKLLAFRIFKVFRRSQS